MKVHTLLIFVLVLSLYLQASFAQQLTNKGSLSTFDFTLNPALTANENLLDIGAFYKQQWVGFENAPRTASLYVQYPFINQNMSIGGFFLHDEVGLFDSDELALSYSYRLRIGLSKLDRLSIGILTRFKQTRFDATNAISTSANDIYLQNDNWMNSDLNIGFGLFYTSNQDMQYNEENTFFVGVGLTQLLPSEEKITDMGINEKLHGSALVGGRFVQDFLFVEPSIWINYAVNSPLHAKASILLEMEQSFWSGLAYRTDNTVELQGGAIVKLWENLLRIGVLGAFNIGITGRERGLGYEFSLAYQVEI